MAQLAGTSDAPGPGGCHSLGLNEGDKETPNSQAEEARPCGARELLELAQLRSDAPHVLLDVEHLAQTAQRWRSLFTLSKGQ